MKNHIQTERSIPIVGFRSVKQESRFIRDHLPSHFYWDIWMVLIVLADIGEEKVHIS